MEESDLEKAGSYREWQAIAYELDLQDDKIAWRKDDYSELFHSQLLQEHIFLMKEYRRTHQGVKLVEAVQESLSRHSWELNSPKLYSEARSGTKFIIKEYFEEIEKSVNFVCENSFNGISDHDKLRILSEGNRVHGSTALLLSGGASFGIYHLGVVKALLDEDLLPSIITGSSMGAIVAAAACSKTDEELKEFFSNLTSIHRTAIRTNDFRTILSAGSVMDPDQLIEHIESNIGNFTFKEAFEKTGRVLNISVSATRVRQRPRVLNHLTAPNLLIGQSTLASCAIPGIFPAVTLMMKDKSGNTVPYMESEKWIDGSIHLDIPMQRIIRLHNVSRSIVSQANPHVIPFVKDKDNDNIITFMKDLITEAVQTQALKIMDLGVNLSEKMPWLSIVDKIRSMMDQQYRGDINIYFPMTLESVTKIVSNPTQEEFEEYIRKGELAAWPKLEFIRDQMKLNRVLENCIGRIQDKLNWKSYE